MERKYIACFFAIAESNFDLLEEQLLTYDVGPYIIAFEDDPKDHFHLLFEGTEQIYSCFSKKIVERFGLRRKGKGGLIRYGKVKEIRDIEKMKSYTCKQKNIRTNIPDSELKGILEKSFVKESKKKSLDMLVEYLDSLQEDIFQTQVIDFVVHKTKMVKRDIYYDETIKKKIIEYKIDHDQNISKSSLQACFLYYLRKTSRLTKIEKIKYIFKFT